MSAVKGRSPNRDHTKDHWQILVLRLHPRQRQVLEQIADEQGISLNEATRRIIDQGLDGYFGVNEE